MFLIPMLVWFSDHWFFISQLKASWYNVRQILVCSHFADHLTNIFKCWAYIKCKSLYHDSDCQRLSKKRILNSSIKIFIYCLCKMFRLLAQFVASFNCTVYSNIFFLPAASIMCWVFHLLQASHTAFYSASRLIWRFHCANAYTFTSNHWCMKICAIRP